MSLTPAREEGRAVGGRQGARRRGVVGAPSGEGMEWVGEGVRKRKGVREAG